MDNTFNNTSKNFRYAKTAKKVDMKRLKVVAWDILNKASIQVAIVSDPESKFKLYFL